jgi:hypothetical protein
MHLLTGRARFLLDDSGSFSSRIVHKENLMPSSLRLTGVSLALFAGLGLSAHAAEPRVVLGVAVPLSGPLAASGQDAVNGCKWR